MKLSILTTLFKSSEYIQEFYTRISIEAQKITQDYEIIFVDDGSPDNSLQKAVALFEMDNRVKVIELSRNFGHHEAIMAGLHNATGDYIYLLDIDLEDQPEWLGLFYKKIILDKCDVVYGQQMYRSGSFLRRISGNLWHYIQKNIFNIHHSTNITTARLMNKNYVNQLKKFPEISFVISSIWNFAGFDQKSININKQFKKKSTYTLGLKLEIILKILITESTRPLKILLCINTIMATLTIVYSLVVVINRIINNEAVPGWSTLVFLISFNYFFISIIFLFVGLYLIEIIKEVKNRPLYIIKKYYR
jgi:putative glycosyltransferase